MARAKLNTDGQTQSVSIRLSHQENDILNRYAAEHGIGRSAAASQLIRTGPALRAEVRSEMLREIHPAVLRMEALSQDLLRFWSLYSFELIMIIGKNCFSTYRDQISDAIRELHELLRVA